MMSLDAWTLMPVPRPSASLNCSGDTSAARRPSSSSSLVSTPAPDMPDGRSNGSRSPVTSGSSSSISSSSSSSADPSQAPGASVKVTPSLKTEISALDGTGTPSGRQPSAGVNSTAPATVRTVPGSSSSPGMASSSHGMSPAQKTTRATMPRVGQIRRRSNPKNRCSTVGSPRSAGICEARRCSVRVVEEISVSLTVREATPTPPRA